MRKTELKRKSAMKRGRRKAKPEVGVNGFTREDWVQASIAQRVCAVTGRRSGMHFTENGVPTEGQPYQNHHVVYEQEVRNRDGDIWDPRNCLRVATFIHKDHHSRSEPIPLRCLRDENLEYAVELMSLAAYGYLTRRYSGHDERLELLIAELGAPDAAG